MLNNAEYGEKNTKTRKPLRNRNSPFEFWCNSPNDFKVLSKKAFGGKQTLVAIIYIYTHKQHG